MLHSGVYWHQAAQTGSWHLVVGISFKFHLQWYHFNSSNSALVSVFTPQKLAKATNQVLGGCFPESQLVHIYPHIAGQCQKANSEKIKQKKERKKTPWILQENQKSDQNRICVCGVPHPAPPSTSSPQLDNIPNSTAVRCLWKLGNASPQESTTHLTPFSYHNIIDCIPCAVLYTSVTILLLPICSNPTPFYT